MQTIPQLFTTEDGSLTLYNSEVGEHYHSTHGAIQESQHIFIRSGLTHRLVLQSGQQSINLLEIGFGTGLNALLTLEYLSQLPHPPTIHYTTVEKYPIPESLWQQLSYPLSSQPLLNKLHLSPWEEWVSVTDAFHLRKLKTDLLELELSEFYDLVYFDAFSPETQPELWSEELFYHIHHHMNEGAVLTTYCAKGEVRRRLQRAGFLVERLPGPPGKREILRASK